MARVTVEDCILNVPNRFELVLVASQRAKQIATGNPLTIDRDNDKDSVVALREIAEKTVSVESLMEDTIGTFSKRRMMDDTRFAPAANDIEESFQVAQTQISSMQAEAANMAFDGDDVEGDD